MYAIYLADPDEETPPSKIWLSTLKPAPDATATMLGSAGTLTWEAVGNGMVINIPASAQQNAPCHYAWTIKISRVLR